MHTINVSTVQEVLEQFRQDVVAALRSEGFRPPAEADTPGNHYQAVAAWVRLQHRSVTKAPRLVRRSNELQLRSVEPAVQSALDGIRAEFERGDDLTHRLSRQFYKAGFNDFLFNSFGIQHIHLGATGAGIDSTNQHVMSGGADALLFVMIKTGEVYFLDVLDHHVFDSPEMSKSLVQIVLRNWPDLLKPCELPGVVRVDMTFEDAFRKQKAGFTTAFEVDGKFFIRDGQVLDGKVNDGKRASCTSMVVVAETNRILNGISRLVEFVEREASTLSELAESRIGTRPTEFKLMVVRAGDVVVVREQNAAIEFFHDGKNCGLLPR